MELRKATRQKAKIRLGLSAVSGGGKTMSALLISYGLCGDWSKIAVIDTENNSADLYAHLGDYNVLPLHPPFAPERYIDAIKDCENAGMDVIIIDSIAHEWEGEGGIMNLTEIIGGGFSQAWKQLTPRHEKFKQAILQSKCHIITTVRRKQEYILQETTNKNGKIVQAPVKAGMKEITREGWEYEVTLNLELDIKHMATASKDRTGLFMDKDPFIPTIETGKKIKQWCESGADPIVIKTTLYNHVESGSTEKPLIPNKAFKQACERLAAGEIEVFDKVLELYTLTLEQCNLFKSEWEKGCKEADKKLEVANG